MGPLLVALLALAGLTAGQYENAYNIVDNAAAMDLIREKAKGWDIEVPPPKEAAVDGKYPDGPSTVAAEDALLQDWYDPGPMVFWVAFYWSMITIFVWTVVRCTFLRPERMAAESEMANMQGETADAMEIPVSDGNKMVTMVKATQLQTQGYTDSWNVGGWIGYSSVWLFSIELLILFLLVLIDGYWGCEASFEHGVDNQCYYGTYPITGWDVVGGIIKDEDYPNGVLQYEAFFWLWVAYFFWFLILIILQAHIRNFFKIPCSLAKASTVYVFLPTEAQQLVKNPSPVVKLSRGLFSWARKMTGYEDGFSLTLPVVTQFPGGAMTRIITFQHQKYVIRDGCLWQPKVNLGNMLGDIVKLTDVTADERTERLTLVGENDIPYRVDTLVELLTSEYFNGFFYYQWIVYMWWFWWSYLFTAAVEFAVVLYGTIMNMLIKRWNQNKILQLTEFSSTESVRVSGKWQSLDGKQLVPGDCVRVRTGQIMACDLILVQGNAIMNEAGLTGESMPVSKVMIPKDEVLQRMEVNDRRATRYKLYAGTTVLQAGNSEDEEVYGIVLKTGINTDKGELVSEILLPFNIRFRFDEELIVVFLMLIVLSVVVFGILYIFWEINGTKKHYVIKMASLTFTCCQLVSPLLPLSLIAGQVASSARLSSRYEVYCVNPQRIAICGKIRVCCFDKTGTLTKEGIDFIGSVKKNKNGSFQEPDTATKDPTMLAALATCHAVTEFVNKETGKTDYVGNQVEVNMFKSTGAKMNEKGDRVSIDIPGLGVADVIRRFEFDHARMTMSVVVQMQNSKEYVVYCKGAAEKIAECCNSLSVSADYLPLANRQAKEGCYVLGLASATLNIDKEALMQMTRDDIEKNLNLEGLILFRNELKPDTAEAIWKLKAGDTRVVMITGDNAQCGYYIGRECGMLAKDGDGKLYPVWLANVNKDNGNVEWTRMDTEDEGKPVSTGEVPPSGVQLAMTGKAFAKLKEEHKEFDDIFLRTRIFARFSPKQKAEVIGKFIDLDLVCGMCGDGGNDCGALRAAHAGLALSDAEASVVSPFTSKSKSVMSMVDLLREGRGALATSFANYKFMIIFGFAYIVTKMSFLYFDTIMAAMGYLWCDVIIIVTVIWALSLTEPLETLGPERPTSTLFGVNTAGTIVAVSFVNMMFTMIANIHMQNAENYLDWPIKCSTGNIWYLMGDNWNAGTVMCTFVFQLLVAGFLMGFGTRFRKPVWRNLWLVIPTIVFWIVFSYVMLAEPNAFIKAFHMPSENFNTKYASSPPWAYYNGYNRKTWETCIGTNTNKTGSVGIPGFGKTCTNFDFPLSEDKSFQFHWDNESELKSLLEWCEPGGEAQGYLNACHCIQNTDECACGKGDAGPSDYAMSFSHRLGLYIIICVNALVALIVVGLVFEGPGRDWWVRRNPDYMGEVYGRVSFEKLGVEADGGIAALGKPGGGYLEMLPNSPGGATI